MTVVTIIVAVSLAIIHLLAGNLRFLRGTPRSIWLSAAGGISVAYVFLHLLPQLAEGQEVMRKSFIGWWSSIEHHAYLVAFAGLVIFYGLERVAKESRRQQRQADGEDRPSDKVFWLHISSFSVYNLLIGYLLADSVRSLRGLGFFATAMGLHFLVNDFGLRDHFGKKYDCTGRWVLAIAVIAGTVAGFAVVIPELAMSLLVAFLAGGVVLNVLKEELPEERESRFSAFLIGGGLYTALLLAL